MNSRLLKVKLRSTNTRVTTEGGKVFVEKREGDGFVKTEIGNSTGFVVDDKPDLKAAEILPNKLFLGSQDVAMDYHLVRQELKITHIVNVATGIPDLYPDAFDYFTMELFDIPGQSINFHKILNFMHCALNADGHKILVHCNAGVSRAATIVIAYLIRYNSMTLHEAYHHVKKLRPAIKPNEGFIRQLVIWEYKTKGQQHQPVPDCDLPCCNTK